MSREAEFKQQEEVKAASEMQCLRKNGRFLWCFMDFVGFIYDLYMIYMDFVDLIYVFLYDLLWIYMDLYGYIYIYIMFFYMDL